MKAKLAASMPAGDWIYEIKFDGYRALALRAAEMKRCIWVKPSMVCEVKFTERTRDDRLRHPVFLGIREDKRASEVLREKVD
jgi:bifunctional non-homologous end joining protein LigD